MCGIITIVPEAERKTAPALLDRLTTTLAHRGPDDSGYAQVLPSGGQIRTWTRESMPAGELGGILFGHRRLSILDLSDAGHQPWVNHETGTVLAYNGEVFNFIELRAELESIGVEFRSRSDTEVLARAYERWGADAFQRLNGMWAFTLWDARRKVLIACRDRFGVKPLYYCRAGGRLVFASEIKALLDVPEIARRVNQQRVHGFLTGNISDQGVETLLCEVRSVAPGTYLEVSRAGAVTERRFYRLRIDPDVRQAPHEALVSRTRSLLADAVALRTRSDVPIGTMLSGGLDSTSITALIDHTGADSRRPDRKRPLKDSGSSIRHSRLSGRTRHTTRSVLSHCCAIGSA